MIEAIERIKLSQYDEVFIGGGIASSEIDEAQKRLGVRFPDDYVKFLEDYGSFTFFGMEILGIITGKLSTGILADCVQVTEFYRISSELPHNLIVIFDNNGDELHTINVIENKYNILAWDVITRNLSRIIASDLKSYVDEKIDESIIALSEPEF